MRLEALMSWLLASLLAGMSTSQRLDVEKSGRRLVSCTSDRARGSIGRMSRCARSS
jgi:hypothetical protein